MRIPSQNNITDGYHAVCLENPLAPEHRWGVVRDDGSVAVLMNAARSLRYYTYTTPNHENNSPGVDEVRRLGHYLTAIPLSLYVAEEGGMFFEQGEFLPKGENIAHTSVNCATVRLNEVLLGPNLDTGEEHYDYRQKEKDGRDGVYSVEVIPLVDSVGTEHRQPGADLIRLQERAVLAIGAGFIAVTAALEETGIKLATESMVPSYTPV